MTDLPPNNTGGMTVKRAPGAAVTISAQYGDGTDAALANLVVQAEPVLLYDHHNTWAWERLVAFEDLLTDAVRTAYKQWARHIRPGNIAVSLQVGASTAKNCGGGHSTVGCYVGGTINTVVLNDTWVLDAYAKWKRAHVLRNPSAEADVFFEVLHLARLRLRPTRHVLLG